MSRRYFPRLSPAPAVPQVEIDFRAELNDQQYEAVTSPPGQALVIAGAGSGKTRTLTYRVAWLIANAVAPENILLLTFTNKAAAEMTSRVDSLLPGAAAGLWSGTFHSVCNRILRRHAAEAGLTTGFTILDSEDQRSLITRAIRELDIAQKVESATGGKFPKAPVIGGLMSLAANTRTPLEEVIASEFSPDSEFVDGLTAVADRYAQKKRESNSVDFDDLLTRTLELFREHPAILEAYQYQFQFILVDEYQDTNVVQGELIDALSGRHGNVMVVGDDAQSIYSWRGADFRNIITFPERYANARVYRIETNYRSAPQILELANAAIQENARQFPKTLRPARPPARQRPVVAVLPRPEEQAMFVSRQLRQLHEEEGIPWEEMAVLYRAHFHSMEVQMQLTVDGVPFVITSGLKFFEQAHIKDMSAFLRFAVNPRDEAAFERMVRLLPGVGPASAARLWSGWLASGAAASGSPPARYSDILERIRVPARAQKDWRQLGYTLDEFVDESGALRPPVQLMMSVFEGVYDAWMKANFDNYESRHQDIEQFMRFAARFGDLTAFLSELSLLSGPEQAEGGSGAGDPRGGVTLSSVHQAKGLEWRVVFVIWLTDTMFPSLRAVESGGDDSLEEERRLFYVAVTRAKDELYLTWPMMWPRSYTGDAWQTPSRFLTGLPSGCVEEWHFVR